MNVQQAYNVWADNYDTVNNKTRDLEAGALRASLADLTPADLLEIGCGTGKNTEWLLTKAQNVVAADFSAEMLAKAKEKITATNVEFKHLDLREPWIFDNEQFDLITCSLALEHIENIDFVFAEAARVLRPGGLFYFGELHPFKQYRGSKARFETGSGTFELECFTHNISDFFGAGLANKFECIELREWFDNDAAEEIPRVLTMIFKVKK